MSMHQEVWSHFAYTQSPIYFTLLRILFLQFSLEFVDLPAVSLDECFVVDDFLLRSIELAKQIRQEVLEGSAVNPPPLASLSTQSPEC